MSGRFANGKYAHGFCDVCNFRYPLKKLKALTINEKLTNILSCPTCFDKDHPQYGISRVDMNDPQSLRNPRPDPSLEASRELE